MKHNNIFLACKYVKQCPLCLISPELVVSGYTTQWQINYPLYSTPSNYLPGTHEVVLNLPLWILWMFCNMLTIWHLNLIMICILYSVSISLLKIFHSRILLINYLVVLICTSACCLSVSVYLATRWFFSLHSLVFTATFIFPVATSCPFSLLRYSSHHISLYFRLAFCFV